MRIGMLLCSVLMLVGCGTNLAGEKRVDLPNELSVHPSFGEKAEVIFQAADEWKKATGGVADLHPQIGVDSDVRVSEVFDGSTDVIGMTHQETWTATIHIDMLALKTEAATERVSEDDELKDTVMHELGHAFGIKHMKTGLMRATGYGGGCIDQLTLDAFCEGYSCPAEAAPTCE